MSPLSLTKSQRTPRPRITTPQPSLQPSFVQQLHGSGLFDLLLQPRSQLYGAVERRRPRIDVSHQTPLQERAASLEDEVESAKRKAECLPTPSEDLFPHHDSAGSDSGMLQYSTMAGRAAAPVSRRKGGPKKVAAKVGKKTGNETASRKRPASRRSSSRIRTKVQKKDEKDVELIVKKEKPHEEANTKKKIGGSTATKKAHADIIDLVSDDDPDDSDYDDDDAGVPTNNSRNTKRVANGTSKVVAPTERKGFFSGLRMPSWNKSTAGTSKDSEADDRANADSRATRPSEQLQNKWSFNSLDLAMSSDEDDLTPNGISISDSTISKRQSNATSNSDAMQQRNAEIDEQLRKCRTDLETQNKRTQSLQDELQRLKLEHADEFQKLSQAHEAEKRKTRDLLEECQSTIKSQQVELQRNEHLYSTELEKLNQELTVAEVENSTLEAAVNELEKTSSDLKIERDELQEELESQQGITSASSAELQVENTALKAALKREKAEHEELMKSLDDRDLTAGVGSCSAQVTSDHQVSELQIRNAALVKELDAIKERERRRTMLSPAPSSLSSSSSEEQTKIENVRKTYIKVKRRYDNLHSVAVNLNTCTRGMDLSSFGEFGQYLRQLKNAMEENHDDGGQRGSGSQGNAHRRLLALTPNSAD